MVAERRPPVKADYSARYFTTPAQPLTDHFGDAFGGLGHGPFATEAGDEARRRPAEVRRRLRRRRRALPRPRPRRAPPRLRRPCRGTTTRPPSPSPVTTRSAPADALATARSGRPRDSKPGERAPRVARPPASPPAAPAPGSDVTSTPPAAPVVVGEPLKPPGEECHLPGRRSLLGSELRGRVGERVVTSQATTSSTPGRRARLEDVERPLSAVGSRRPAEADDDPPGAGSDGRSDELAGAGASTRSSGRCRQGRRPAAGPTPGPSRSPRSRRREPLGLDRLAEWTMDRRAAHTAPQGSQRIEQTLAAVGDRGHVTRPSEGAPGRQRSPRPRPPRWRCLGTCPGRQQDGAPVDGGRSGADG